MNVGDSFVREFVIVAISYLLGSFPTAYLGARLKGVDIFSVGSGNMGATNVQRTLGWRWALPIGLADVGKGILAVLIAQALWPENKAAATTIAAVVTVVGHNWSLFATVLTGRIRGGKGMAVTFGTLLMIAPSYVIVGVLVVGITLIVLTRYVSLGVLVMSSVMTVSLLILVREDRLAYEYTFYALAILALIFVRHRTNIQRLLTGTERRLGDRI